MNKAKPSHIPLFPDAYIRDNYRLSLEQHGLFLLLMMEAWNHPNCCLPDDDTMLAQIAQVPIARFRKIAPAVLAKWTREDGVIFQKRLRKEWLYVQEKSAKARAAINERWDRQKGYGRNTDVIHLGGGGGEGEGLEDQTHEEEVKGLASAREGFAVVEGGRR